MTKKLAALLLFSAMTVSLLASCSDGGGKIMEMPSVPVESYESTECASGEVLVNGENNISEDLFRYIYLTVKGNLLSDMKMREEAGYDVTGDKDILVGDTEAFWNCVFPGSGDDSESAIKDVLYDYTFKYVKDMLAIESVARDYALALPGDYRERLEKAIAADVAQGRSHYLDDGISFADENGKVYDWVKDRRKMHLASQGVTAGDWERIFCLDMAIAGKLQDHLVSLGVISMESDEKLLERARADLKEQLKTFLEDNVKSDYFYFNFRKDGDASEESAAETSEESVSAEEYNRQILKKCEKILAGIKDGSLDFASEAKKADGSENDSINDKKVLAQVFGESAENRHPGDIVLLTNEMSAFIFVFKEVTKEDFRHSEEPTEDELAKYKDESLSKSLNELLEKYRNAVIIDELILEKYRSPWKIK